MNGKVIPYTTNKGLFFRQYLELVKILNPYRKLRAKELDVLAELMRYNDMYINIPYDDRWKLILHSENRQKIRETLGDMSDANFQNILSSFRKKGILVDNQVPEKYLFPLDGKTFEFKILFKIED